MDTSGIKKWWHSFTIWFGNAMAVAGTVIQQIDTSSSDLRAALGHYGGAVIAALGVAVILLRLKTKSAVAGTPAAKSLETP
jgi:membrane protein DedA with SNARE-associated domain